ncbi:hypothetical protein [Kribbella speibonae]|uniref:Uncharacterized protein n=1 Tax=Kribbella speibonae TaxID=1572660 RepID=A0A4R0J0Z4_9ACTN|nr:hypothetical protein [Kribbella speibonae]TCC25640.1 hypothetical protein E0H58_16170 [Kribbella speibonae]TCC37766.1 hypothetical protein E0H92_14870 [Kribbella speibonae]
MVRRILVLVVLLFAFGATPAHAGGPTSVLLSAPPSVVAFGYNDPRYDELVELTAPTSDKPTGEHRSGRFVRATWLIHDMSVWRIDIIYPDAPGGPWIATEDLMSGTQPAKPTWHRATDPARLLKLLNELKLLSGEFYGGPSLDGGYTAQESTPEPAPAADPPAQAQASTSTNVFTGWRWIIPGVLLGAAAAVLAVRLFPKRRWELID